MKNYYTKEEDDKIVKLRASGSTISQIASELCRSKNSIQARILGQFKEAVSHVYDKPPIDYVGQRFGSLVVIEMVHAKKRGTGFRAVCKCDCGTIRDNIKVWFLKKGITTSCGCKKDWIKSGKENVRFTGTGDLYGTFWYKLLERAKSRKYEVSISMQQAWELFKKQNKKCALTGLMLRLGARPTASLDRIDNKKHYTLDNVQWVHKIINIMKSVFPNDVFINFCRRVADNCKDTELITTDVLENLSIPFSERETGRSQKLKLKTNSFNKSRSKTYVDSGNDQ